MFDQKLHKPTLYITPTLIQMICIPISIKLTYKTHVTLNLVKEYVMDPQGINFGMNLGKFGVTTREYPLVVNDVFVLKEVLHKPHGSFIAYDA